MISRDIRRKFGQNYLSDPAIIFEMGQAISPQTNSNFFEIGPGMGALTNVLNQDGISIKAIDIDKNNIDYLSKQFTGPAKFEFFQGDILTTSLNFLEDENYRIVGNLPYNISTQIILKFIDWHNVIQDMHFLVQKEVAERIVAREGKKRGIISVLIETFYDSEYCFTVNEDVFINDTEKIKMHNTRNKVFYFTQKKAL